MHSDPIADMATRMRNALQAGHSNVLVPYSKIKEAILNVLKDKGYIADFQTVKNDKFEELDISFKEEKREMNITRVSSPGRRIFRSYKDIKPVRSGFGISVVTTSKGVMAGYDAYSQKIGGEILLEVY